MVVRHNRFVRFMNAVRSEESSEDASSNTAIHRSFETPAASGAGAGERTCWRADDGGYPRVVEFSGTRRLWRGFRGYLLGELGDARWLCARSAGRVSRRWRCWLKSAERYMLYGLLAQAFAAHARRCSADL